jgi:aspartyl-tRNA(Asn)/glutamyl-tRNA(Gln) amidotransferase subunit C
MKKNLKVNQDLISVIESLSHLFIEKDEKSYLTRQFNETLTVVDRLGEINTTNINPTNQVTGLINVFRRDEIDKERALTQEDALSGSAHTYKGFFVVKAIFDGQ